MIGFEKTPTLLTLAKFEYMVASKQNSEQLKQPITSYNFIGFFRAKRSRTNGLLLH